MRKGPRKSQRSSTECFWVINPRPAPPVSSCPVKGKRSRLVCFWCLWAVFSRDPLTCSQVLFFRGTVCSGSFQCGLHFVPFWQLCSLLLLECGQHYATSTVMGLLIFTLGDGVRWSQEIHMPLPQDSNHHTLWPQLHLFLDLLEYMGEKTEQGLPERH